jgi:hypothetical protein
MVYPHIRYLGPSHPTPFSGNDPASIGELVTPVPARPRELESRVNDGIHVRLLWHPADGRVSVAVHDAKTGEAFELPVGEGERALDVYHHPYAYAAGTHAPAAGSARHAAPSAVSS